LKAGVDTAVLQPSQKILFLSFARATVSRVAESIGQLVARDAQKLIETNTYHGFTWRILRSHGYLLTRGGPVRLLSPPDGAALLSGLPEAAREAKKIELFQKEGILHFDLFAPATVSLLARSEKLRNIICDAYPTIILDEFQ